MEPTFGSTIRDRRNELRLSLRDVANATGIDFTYLSKVETGRFPPPSEEVIAKLSRVLDLDSDALLALANKVGADIHQIIVSNPETAKLLRAWRDHGPAKAKEILNEEMEKAGGDTQES
jgi:transcriptional regulator with XRE-family HTH domain